MPLGVRDEQMKLSCSLQDLGDMRGKSWNGHDEYCSQIHGVNMGVIPFSYISFSHFTILSFALFFWFVRLSALDDYASGKACNLFGSVGAAGLV